MTLPRCDSVAALYALQNSMMLTPCWPSAGPTGGAGLACPAWICSLISPTTFFFGAMRCWCSFLDLGDLVEGQFNRCFAAEDGHQHLELLLFGVDLADRGGQRRKRTVHDGHRLADLKVNLDDRAFNSPGLGGGTAGRCGLAGLLRLALRQQELDDVVQRQRRRPGCRTDEAGDAGGVAHRAPGLVVEFHADQDVARQHLAVDMLALPVLYLCDLFGGHLHLEEIGRASSR